MSNITADKLDIYELTNRYANAMDFENLESWLDTWIENGQWSGGPGVFKGKEELTKLFKLLGPRLKNKRHIMTNNVITINGTSAKQTCYMLVYDRVESSPLIASAVYEDILKKVDGSWFFADRIISMDPRFKP